MGGFGASIEKDPANGDFTVTINSPEAKRALDLYIELLTNYGPPEYGSLSQGNLIQYMLTGKVAHIISATAAWSSMDNPEKSEVVDKVNVAVIPKPEGGKYSCFLGSWCMAIPSNLPDERKQAALAFAKWFLTYEAQYEYGKFGAVPVRIDTYDSDLAGKHEFRWFDAYAKSIPTAVAYMGYEEGAQVADVLGLRLNQAIIGELSSAQALNKAAEEIHAIFKKSGRKTGMLEPLPE
jgi:multiple sugar transport system substrate-binding protein